MSPAIRNTATVLMFGALVAVLMAAQPVLGEGPIKDEDVKKLAVSVINAAHPTGKKPALLEFTQTVRDNIVLLKLKVEYYGAASANRFTADSLIQIQLPKKPGDPLEVKSIDFVDNNNSIKPNTKNLDQLKAELNARFRIDAAK